MKRILTSLAITASCLVCFPGTGLAESQNIQNRDGTSGHLSHLGDDIGIYSDPHGNQIIVPKPSTESPIGLRPHGETESGNRSAFGTPLPPNNLTPAPVLPLNPNRALSPALSPNSHIPSSGSGRLGR
ncbi:MAG: hypothetical protein HOP35_15655 [Nitrospira sp.]|nr:hypothetical protein [Nitrospira sp.]